MAGFGLEQGGVGLGARGEADHVALAHEHVPGGRPEPAEQVLQPVAAGGEVDVRPEHLDEHFDVDLAPGSGHRAYRLRRAPSRKVDAAPVATQLKTPQQADRVRGGAA